MIYFYLKYHKSNMIPVLYLSLQRTNRIC